MNPIGSFYYRLYQPIKYSWSIRGGPLGFFNVVLLVIKKHARYISALIAIIPDSDICINVSKLLLGNLKVHQDIWKQFLIIAIKWLSV